MLMLSMTGELAMARTLAALPEGSRITDYISLGVITKTFPLKRVRAVLAATGKASQRERDLPAHVVVYYAIALALYMQSSYREVLRCLLEGVQWLLDPAVTLKVAGNSGISQARTRLGWEVLRQLHDEVVKPIAVAATKGAWYRGLRLVSVDGSTLEVADESANAAAFGRPGASRGVSAFPQCALCRWSRTAPTCCLAPDGAYATRRDHLGQDGVGRFAPGHAVFGRPQFLRFRAVGTGAHHGGRPAVANQEQCPLAVRTALVDGSYLSRIYPSESDRRHQRNAVTVRVIEYRLQGVADVEPIYRLLTSHARSRASAGRPNSPPSITSAGRSKPPWPN